MWHKPPRFTVRSVFSSLFISCFDDDRATAITCRVSSRSNKNLHISCVYIPPGYPLSDSKALSYLHEVMNVSCDFQIVSGNFSRPDFDWRHP